MAAGAHGALGHGAVHLADRDRPGTAAGAAAGVAGRGRGRAPPRWAVRGGGGRRAAAGLHRRHRDPDARHGGQPGRVRHRRGGRDRLPADPPLAHLRRAHPRHPGRGDRPGRWGQGRGRAGAAGPGPGRAARRVRPRPVVDHGPELPRGGADQGDACHRQPRPDPRQVRHPAAPYRRVRRGRVLPGPPVRRRDHPDHAGGRVLRHPGRTDHARAVLPGHRSARPHHPPGASTRRCLPVAVGRIRDRPAGGQVGHPRRRPGDRGDPALTHPEPDPAGTRRLDRRHRARPRHHPLGRHHCTAVPERPTHRSGRRGPAPVVHHRPPHPDHHRPGWRRHCPHYPHPPGPPPTTRPWP